MPTKEELEKKLFDIEEEYNMYGKKVEMATNPDYIKELRERILSMDLKIKKWEKSRKSIELKQKRNESKITKNEFEEPDVSLELAQMKTELNNYGLKIAETDKIIEKNAQTMGNINVKYEETKEKHQKEIEEAKFVGLDLSGINEMNQNVILKKYRDVKVEKDNIIKTINLLKTRYNMTLQDYQQKITKSQQKVEDIAILIQSKNEYILLGLH